MTNHISRVCFREQNTQKSTVQQGNQATTTTTAGNTTNNSANLAELQGMKNNTVAFELLAGTNSICRNGTGKRQRANNKGDSGT